jgi:hypothetical protein
MLPSDHQIKKAPKSYIHFGEKEEEETLEDFDPDQNLSGQPDHCHRYLESTSLYGSGYVLRCFRNKIGSYKEAPN